MAHDPNSDDKVYVPQHSEILAMYIGDPADWEPVRDLLAEQWIALQAKKK